MVRIEKIRLLAASLFLVCGTASVAQAADKLFPEDTPIVYGDKRQEFGTGWYLRGDIGWSRDRMPALSGDGTLASAIRTRNIASLSIGYGYKFNNWFRADVTAEYRAPQWRALRSASTFACPTGVLGYTDPITTLPAGITAVESQCRSQEVSKLKRGTLMFNAYVDLGTWAGVTPFVGAGVGLAYGRAQGMYDWIDTASNSSYQANLTAPAGFPTIWLDSFGNPARAYQFGNQARTRGINQTRFNFAWSLMAGLAVDVSKNAKMEISYRYLNMGKWGNARSANTAHDVRLGFRYNID